MSIACYWVSGFLIGSAIGGFIANRRSIKQLNEMRAVMEKFYQCAMDEHSKK
jgi:uncharacterized protein YneF (UPF0154 family)